MVFGLDIDGTIGAEPDVFAALGRSLLRAGHQVHVITSAALAGCPPEHSSYPWRQQQLAGYGLKVGVHYNALHICEGDSRKAIGKAKADLCQRLGVRLMIDDNPIYCAQISDITRCLLVLDRT